MSADTPVIYEVNLAVRPDAAPAFRAWLGPHVDELLALRPHAPVGPQRVDALGLRGRRKARPRHIFSVAGLH